MADLITREKAISLGLSRYDSEYVCPKGHLKQRFVSTYRCCECNLIDSQVKRKSMDAETRQAYLAKNREQKRAKAKAKRVANEPAKEAERQRIKQVQAEHGLDLPTSRAEALACGSKYYFNAKPCPKGHLTKRSAVWTGCEICVNESGRNNAKLQRIKYPERLKARAKAYYEKNSEYVKNYVREYTEKNKELVLAKKRQYQKDNPEVYRHNGSKRRAAKRQAVPKWLTKEQNAEIKAIYAEASRLTDSMGNKLHVDHIVPLRGKTVSGLHVPWNLRLATKRENFTKGRKFDPFLGLPMPLPLGCGATLGSYQLN